MREVKMFFTGGNDNSLKLFLTENEIMTLKEWIINESPTITMNIESEKAEITLFRAHISGIKYSKD